MKDEMTVREKNLQIAEYYKAYRGWLRIADYGEDNIVFEYYQKGELNEVPVPDYFTDLNAMHEVLKVLSEVEYQSYRFRLMNVIGVQCANDRQMHEATAKQKAKAFLLTMAKRD